MRLADRADETLFYLPNANRWPMEGRSATAIFFVLFAFLCVGLPAPSAGAEVLANQSWTIMLYMANDVSTPLPWEDNINSMEAAEQTAGVSILALVDNPADGDSVLLKIEHDASTTWPGTIVSTQIDDSGAVIPGSGEADLANPSTLAAFVEFAATEFPADRLVLVLWGHGAGWHGLCLDKGDLLTLPELGQALGDATASLGRDIDMVVVDACAEATLEMLAELSPHVGYFVGAQNNVPYQGLPYEQILGSLSEHPDQSVEEFASAIVAEYIDYAWFVSPYSATMAAFDLAQMDAVFSQLEMLSVQGVKYNSIFHDVINSALASAEYYDTEWYVDLVDLMTVIHGSDLPLEMKTIALQTCVAFREALVAFEKYDHPDPLDGVGVSRASGAVIYAPSSSFYELDYSSLALSVTTHWDEFGNLARTVMPTEPMAPGPTISYVDSDDDGLQDTAFLVWGESHPLVEAWVYSRMPNGVLLEETLDSTDSNISIQGRIGSLVVAASALDSDGDAVSYATVDVVLYGRVRLDFVLRVDGEQASESFDVHVLSSTYSGYAIASDGVQTISLIVPMQASVGEMIVIRVLSGQDVLLTCRHVIGEHDSTIVVDLYEYDGAYQPPDAALLAFSLLPALLLGAFSIILYIDQRKKAQGE